MDKHTLITIVITAVITATITLLVTGFFSIAKRVLVSSTLKKTVKKAFSKRIRDVLLSLFFFSFSLSWVWSGIDKPSPPTRWEVAGIAVSVLVAGVWFVVVVFNLIELVISHKIKD